MKNLSSILHKLKYVSFSIITTRALFKIYHWPGADVLILAGGLTLSIVFMITAFGTPPSQNDDTTI